LNKATPKDEYPMPVVDMLINNASGNRVFSFLDGNARYNQIFMVEENMSKTTFICPVSLGEEFDPILPCQSPPELVININSLLTHLGMSQNEVSYAQLKGN
jgi:short-subunit dehydrogenase involved in D-alanine esterification of teichoic acids